MTVCAETEAATEMAKPASVRLRIGWRWVFIVFVIVWFYRMSLAAQTPHQKKRHSNSEQREAAGLGNHGECDRIV